MARDFPNCLADVDVIILAGGLGTRLRPLVSDRPKVLAPVRGRAFLDHILEWLYGFGARRVILSLGYKAEAVMHHLDREPCEKMEILPVIEDKPLGTGGAVRLASEATASPTVLILNGDTLVDADLCAFVAAHRESDAKISVMYAEVDDGRRYGRLVIAEGRIQAFKEKDTTYQGSAKVSAGIYLFERSALLGIPSGRVLSLETDFLACLEPGSVKAWGEDVRFLDIGTPESFLAANKVVFGGPPGGVRNS